MRQSSNFVTLMRLNSIAQRVLSVAEPSDQLIIQNFPDDYKIPDGRDHITVVSANLWHDWPRHRDLRQRLECSSTKSEDYL